MRTKRNGGESLVRGAAVSIWSHAVRSTLQAMHSRHQVMPQPISLALRLFVLTQRRASSWYTRSSGRNLEGLIVASAAAVDHR